MIDHFVIIQIIEVETQCLIMIAVCRGGNTDLKCLSSTLQRVFWQVMVTFQKESSTEISRTIRRSLPGTKLQGSSGARPSEHLPEGCVLVRGSQKG